MRKQKLVLVGAIVILILTGFAIQVTRSAGESPLVAPVFREFPPELNQTPMPRKGVTVPEELKICLDHQTGEQFDVSAIAKDKGNTFYLLAVYKDPNSHNPLTSRDELIALGKKYGCLGLIQPGKPMPLSLYLPTSVVRDLELQRFRHWIKQMGGKQKFEAALAAEINFPDDIDFYYLSAEQVWAMQQLGIKFPNTYKPLSPEIFSSNFDQWRKDLLDK